jgi:hypothetical protein
MNVTVLWDAAPCFLAKSDRMYQTYLLTAFIMRAILPPSSGPDDGSSKYL